MSGHGGNKGEQRRRYMILQWKNSRILYFDNNIEHMTLVQIMDTTGTVNNFVSITV